MTELEKIKRAKDYIDKLANGIDPISGETIEDDTALNNVRLSRCFFYVADILSQVIENDGVIGKRVVVKASDLPPFTLLYEMREKIEITQEPTMISKFADRINGLVDLTTCGNYHLLHLTRGSLQRIFSAKSVSTTNGEKADRNGIRAWY